MLEVERWIDTSVPTAAHGIMQAMNLFNDTEACPTGSAHQSRGTPSAPTQAGPAEARHAMCYPRVAL